MGRLWFIRFAGVTQSLEQGTGDPGKCYGGHEGAGLAHGGLLILQLCAGDPKRRVLGDKGGMHSCLPVSTRAGHGLTSALVSLSKTNSST